MDTEEAFWNHLEANPSDSVARMVFADWLQEQGDQRAEGMRVLGKLEIQPGTWGIKGAYFRSGYWYWVDVNRPAKHRLSRLWWSKFYKQAGGLDVETHFTRSECESLAALAWLDLTQEERDAIYKLD